MTIGRYFSNPGGAGGNIPPGTFTEGSVIFAAADGSLTQDNANLFFNETDKRLGIGINASLQATVHIKGIHATDGSAFYVQNSTTEIFRIYNNRKIVAGGGSPASNTDYTFNAFGGVTASDYSFQIVGTDSDNILRVSNGSGISDAGVQAVRSTVTNRKAFGIYVGATRYSSFNANGSLEFNTATDLTSDDGSNYIKYTNNATTPGFYFLLGNANNAGFTFRKGSGATEQATSIPVYNFLTSLAEVNVNATVTYFKLSPTYNYTGSGAASVIGLDYNATVTSLTGTHYGFLFRTPSSLNGIGLASSMPTALLHLAGSTTARASLRIESGTLPTGGAILDGNITYDGTDLNLTVGSTNRILEFAPRTQTVNATGAGTSINLSLGNVIILNLQVATSALTLTNPRVGTYIIIAKQDVTGGRLLTYATTLNFAGGVAPVLTATANASDVITVVYDGTNFRTAVSLNHAV